MNEADVPLDLERPRAALEDVLSRAEFHRPADQPPHWLDELLQRLLGGLGPAPEWVGTAITVLVVAAAVTFVVYVLVDGGAFRRRRRGGAPAPSATTSETSGVPARSWYDQGRNAFDAGRHSEAVVLLFRGIVGRLAELGFLLRDTSRTNREHLRDLRVRPREEAMLRVTIPPFERVCYGAKPAEEKDARVLLEAATHLFADGTR